MSLPELQTPMLVASNILYIFLLYQYSKGALLGKIFTQKKNVILILFALVFCLFSFWGWDWWGYYHYYLWSKGGDINHIPMEEPYLWLLKNVCQSYIQFRLIVWGGALLLFLWCIKFLKLNLSLSLFFFCCIFLIYFSYARVSLAITMMTLGYCLICDNNTNILKKIFGLIIIASSFYFHKSAILGICAVILSLIINKWGKTGIYLAILLYPVAIIAMTAFFNGLFIDIANSEGSTMAEYATRGANYLDAESKRRGIGTFVQKIIFEQVMYYIIAYCSYKELKHPTIQHKPVIKALFVLVFIEILTSTLFLFNLGVNTNLVNERFVRFAQIPSCFILVYLYQNNIQNKLVGYAYKIGIIGCFYSLIYTMYNVMVG